MKVVAFQIVFFVVAIALILAVGLLFEPIVESIFPSANESVSRLDLIAAAVIFWVLLKSTSDFSLRKSKDLESSLDRLRNRVENLESKRNG